MSELVPGTQNFTKCYDDTDQTPISHYGRGRAGVSFMWTEDIHQYINPLEDGSERVAVISIDCVPPTVIINTYLPAGNTREDLCSYEGILDEVYEITQKYAGSHQIIWVRDLNGSFERTPPCGRDSLLRTFCKEMCIDPDACYTATCYHNNSILPTSRLDHILQISPKTQFVETTHVKMREALNNSPHDPVITSINVTLGSPELSQDEEQEMMPVKARIKWDRVDTAKYKELTSIYTHQLMISIDQQVPAEKLLCELNKLMYKASEESATYPVNGCKTKAKKKNNRPWNPDLKPLVKQARSCYTAWRDAGKPTDGPTRHRMKAAKRGLRSTQRELQAIARKEVHEEIMKASEDDQPLYFQLVKKQRTGTTDVETSIVFDGRKKCGPALCEAWAGYFQSLASPKDLPEFDVGYHERVCARNDLLQTRQEDGDVEHLKTTEEMISKNIMKLKNAKAPDEHGISSEHLKLADPVIIPIVQTIIKKIVETEKIPKTMKNGIITPVYKNKGSTKTADNYRRITVTSMVGKILEMVMVHPVKKILRTKLNKLQRGFCEGAGSANTAFIVSEAAAESLDAKTPLYVTFLDASKAFDVVWHASMLNKMYDLGVTGKLWRLFRDMYTDMTSRVKWGGRLSQVIVEGQGVRQGGIPSTELFKGRCDHLINTLEQTNHGYSIGSIDCSVPTCADDMCLLANSAIDLQVMMNLAVNDTDMERYQFNTKKSKVMVLNSRTPHETWQQQQLWTLSKNQIDVSDQEVHLGITRTPDCKSSATVASNIKRARRSLYATMGAGMHGLNGLHPKVSVKIWRTFIVPSLTYGLEVVPLTGKNMEDLEMFQRLTMRYLQHLPQGTASAAVLLLTGVLPVEAVIDQKVLTTFVSMCRLDDSKEREILQRQLAMKSSGSNSLIVRVKAILSRYDLPSAYTLYESPPRKLQWKKVLRMAINQYWTDRLRLEASRKITLQYMNVHSCTLGTMHHVWSSTNLNPTDILRASVKVKIVTQQYQVQAKKVKYKGGSSVCPMCHDETEDMKPFLLVCRATAPERQKGLQLLQRVLSEMIGRKESMDLMSSSDNLMNLIVDCSHPNLKLPSDMWGTIEAITRRMCYSLHLSRSVQTCT